MRNVLVAVLATSALAGATTDAPVPKALKKPRRAVIEPLPGEKVYSVTFDDLPFAKVAEELERLTGLVYLSKDTPDVRVTLKAEKLCSAELFEQINELLEPANWVLVSKAQSFALVQTDVKLDRMGPNIVTLEELPRRPREVVQVILPVGEKGFESAVEARRAIGKNTIELSTFGSNKLLDCGVGAEVQKLVAEMGGEIKK